MTEPLYITTVTEILDGLKTLRQTQFASHDRDYPGLVFSWLISKNISFFVLFLSIQCFFICRIPFAKLTYFVSDFLNNV